MVKEKNLLALAKAAHSAYFTTDATDQEAPFNAAQAAARNAGADDDTADLLAFILDWYHTHIETPVRVETVVYEFRRAEQANERDPEAWRLGLMASENTGARKLER